MSKKLKDVCFIIQSRLGSQRVPNKMLKPFANTTLFDIAIQKILKSSIIPKEQFYVSIYEKELIEVAQKYPINIYHRSWESSHIDKNIQIMFEWYNNLPYKYVIMISACNPFLSIETIDNFINCYLDSNDNGAFGVIQKRNYYWNNDGVLMNNWPASQDLLNTKAVEPSYEAGHCLYASKMEDIGKGKWVGNWKTGEGIMLYSLSEFESLDIDYEWQFRLLESFYEKYIMNKNFVYDIHKF